MDTLFVGQNLINLNEVDSTNTYAIELLKSIKAIEGTIVLADKQTSGKGQRGNQWVSEPSMNLTFTLILYPVFFNANNHFYLSKIIALALYDALTEVLKRGQHDIKIKWPNDIIVDNKKIAGVLIENSFRNTSVQQAIIGIGLNVNQESFGSLQNRATSLKNICSQPFILREVLNVVCKYIETWYLKGRSLDFSFIDMAYGGRLYLYNEWRYYKNEKGDEFKARLSHVDADGKLVMELESGRMKKYEVKEIVFPESESSSIFP